LFDENKVDEVSYKRRHKTYKKTYPKFKYDSPFVAFENNFNSLDFNQYEVGPSGKA
jgi:hypothetical protein